MGSAPNQMNVNEWRRWLRNTLLFSTPTILALLISLQSFITSDSFFPSQENWIFIFGSAYQAFLASAIDWFTKFKADNRERK